MIYAIAASFAPLVFQITASSYNAPWLPGLAYLPLLLLLTYYYGEPLIAVSAFLTALYVMAALAMEVAWGKLLLPFIVMIYAGTVWYFVRNFIKKKRVFIGKPL